MLWTVQLVARHHSTHSPHRALFCPMQTWQSTLRATAHQRDVTLSTHPRAAGYCLPKLSIRSLAKRDAFSEQVPPGKDTSILSIIVMLLVAISRWIASGGIFQLFLSVFDGLPASNCYPSHTSEWTSIGMLSPRQWFQYGNEEREMNANYFITMHTLFSNQVSIFQMGLITPM